jgi:hypothetical protein
MAGIAEQFRELATVACVPVGLSRYSGSPEIRPHTDAEANAVLDKVHEWQELFSGMLGRRLVYAADEYYLITGRPFPEESAYEGFAQHENGIGMARAFELSFNGDEAAGIGTRSGFFSWVDGAPATGYRAPRSTRDVFGQADAPDREGVTIVTGEYGAMVLGPLVDTLPFVDLLPVHNEFFGGNIGVTGLLTGTDIRAALEKARPQGRVLLPDVCLSEDRFLDGTTIEDLPIDVEVVATDGLSLRRALANRPEPRSPRSSCGADNSTTKSPVRVTVGATR